MDPKKIERINELARKKKEAGLTEAELAEQAELRREYLDGYRRNLKAMLDSIVVEEKDGTFFLKTAFPNRVYQRRYENGELRI